MVEYFDSMTDLDLKDSLEIGTEVAESLEWAIASPAPFHAYEEVPTEFDKF